MNLKIVVILSEAKSLSSSSSGLRSEDSLSSFLHSEFSVNSVLRKTRPNSQPDPTWRLLERSLRIAANIRLGEFMSEVRWRRVVDLGRPSFAFEVSMRLRPRW